MTAATERTSPQGPPSRVVVESVSPTVDGGRFPAKAVIGDDVTIEADVFGDGHDRVAAAVLVRHRDDEVWQRHPMRPTVNDRWTATVVPDRLGGWQFRVVGWTDPWTTWCQDAEVKVDADVLTAVDLAIGATLLRGTATAAPSVAEPLRAAAARLEAEQLAEVLADDRVHQLMWRHCRSGPEAGHERQYGLDVDRERAAFSAWYELFPRSWGEPGHHGTLADVAERLDYPARLGFDVIYLPPIHPIGVSHRKGPNNVTSAGPDDVGSPWAIGSTAGGHTAIHPQLGTVADLRRLQERAEGLGMELALDLAFQCSPDHPWVVEHPQWFRHRPDGSIQYAENPPKKYEDIYPIDFETPDWWNLWLALRAVVRHWMGEGIRIFRVDNPHTKAFAFWEWLLDDIRTTDPDVVFLAEAFTRPKLMYRLAKAGFDQSYTYFTWRTSAWELRSYLEELTTPPVSDLFRPNFWPNTPDILVPPLTHGDRPAFVARAVLAATLSSNWGVYGPAFELMENRPRPPAEEYLDNEKYEIRQWDLEAPHSLAPVLASLNRSRRDHPALQRNDTLRFHDADNPAVLAYSKTRGADRVLCVVSTATDTTQEATLHLDLDALGLAHDAEYVVHDQLGGGRWQWHGAHNYVRLDPGEHPAHVFVVEPVGGTGLGEVMAP